LKIRQKELTERLALLVYYILVVAAELASAHPKIFILIMMGGSELRSYRMCKI